MIIIGYIIQTNEKGCFIKISENTTVRAGLNELSDTFLLNPVKKFPINKLVIGKIT